MHRLPEPVQNLIDAFARLPGIGPKTASRLTFFLLRAPEDLATSLSQALLGIKKDTKLCEVCFNITLKDRLTCEICTSPLRDAQTLCIVEEPLDVLAIEKTAGYNGLYHVLHGVLSPIEGVGPEDLKIKELLIRLESQDFKEVILATNPSMEGDATAMYLHERIAPLSIRVTRLARGLPVGGDLEYADQNTLLRALAGREHLD
ncbi:MAG TPA: recombination mediator RecR [Brevefilum sp.]|nr:recombination mediator RecR [Brevefilum sp.]HOR20181.1 recombination mediator RecR [Brevefilum sp.]HPL69739.1 recombination mediator RecR [Brevefilum sp.]